MRGPSRLRGGPGSGAGQGCFSFLVLGRGDIPALRSRGLNRGRLGRGLNPLRSRLRGGGGSDSSRGGAELSSSSSSALAPTSSSLL